MKEEQKQKEKKEVQKQVRKRQRQRQRSRERLREKVRELCDIYLSDCSAGQDSSTHLNEDRTHLALLRPKIQTKTTETQTEIQERKSV
jgi:hypothetical protein